MTRGFLFLCCVVLGVLAFPYRSPAPLIYRPGEGWVYEKPGETGNWVKTRAKDQLEVAQQAFDIGNYKLALKSSLRTVNIWPLSDYAPQAQYLAGRCYEAEGKDEVAFKRYQMLLEKYPKIPSYEDVLQRQFEIANRYLGGQWFRLWTYIPLPPSMDKTADMYEKIVKNGPYSEVGPKAQMNIGEAREKQKDYPLAAKAYERAADRYADRKKVASDATYKTGMAYLKEVKPPTTIRPSPPRPLPPSTTSPRSTRMTSGCPSPRSASTACAIFSSPSPPSCSWPVAPATPSAPPTDRRLARTPFRSIRRSTRPSSLGWA